MGFLDSLLGRTKAKPVAAQDRLFALTTAYITLDTGHNITTRGTAAILFQPLDTADFDGIVSEMEQLVRGTGEETGTTLTAETDSYGDRTLAAVFSFKDARDRQLYLIYNYKRGTWYPFVPGGGEQSRDAERELQLKAILGTELPVEPELERWLPMWGIPI